MIGGYTVKRTCKKQLELWGSSEPGGFEKLGLGPWENRATGWNLGSLSSRKRLGEAIFGAVVCLVYDM